MERGTVPPLRWPGILRLAAQRQPRERWLPQTASRQASMQWAAAWPANRTPAGAGGCAPGGMWPGSAAPQFSLCAAVRRIAPEIFQRRAWSCWGEESTSYQAKSEVATWPQAKGRASASSPSYAAGAAHAPRAAFVRQPLRRGYCHADARGPTTTSGLGARGGVISLALGAECGGRHPGALCDDVVCLPCRERQPARRGC